MNIYLLGVSHDFQTKRGSAFEKYVKDSCSFYGIMSIGEEMCQDALDNAGVTISRIKMIAENIGLPHAYCGPGGKEREDLGILGELRIKVLQHHFEWTDEKFNEEVIEDRKKREIVWLDRIKPIFQDPMLFVCGIAHLDTFGALLSTNGYTYKVLEKKWDSRPSE